jgi:alkanesulfonate monooxygenase SsuD/methylene tetrahydromethanopterin reductase-like flavin-dependent oxidoreductase (luciferase family)
MGKNQWVVRHGDGWAQRGEGNEHITRTFDRQQDAINAARETARREQSELIIQGEDGQVRERNSYGNDPHPPKG